MSTNRVVVTGYGVTRQSVIHQKNFGTVFMTVRLVLSQSLEFDASEILVLTLVKSKTSIRQVFL